MFDKKRALVCMICLYVVGVCSSFPVLAAPTTLTPFTVISPMALVTAVIMTVVYVRIKKRENAQKEQAELGNVDKALKNAYDSLKLKDSAELGTVKFVRENIVFSATGKYVLAKDFNGQSGYHLAVEIRGTKLLSAPADYDDTLDYASNLFRINLGYFDGVALSTPENDNGMVFKTDALQGKKNRRPTERRLYLRHRHRRDRRDRLRQYRSVGMERQKARYRL